MANCFVPVTNEHIFGSVPPNTKKARKICLTVCFDSVFLICSFFLISNDPSVSPVCQFKTSKIIWSENVSMHRHHYICYMQYLMQLYSNDFSSSHGEIIFKESYVIIISEIETLVSCVYVIMHSRILGKYERSLLTFIVLLKENALKWLHIYKYAFHKNINEQRTFFNDVLTC
jgi:hypothetical protein